MGQTDEVSSPQTYALTRTDLLNEVPGQQVCVAKVYPSPCSVPVTSPALAGMNPTNITCPSLPKCFLINLQPFFYLYLLNFDTHLSIQDDFHPSSATKNSCKNIHSTSCPPS